MFNPTLLRTFVTVASAKSFTAASIHLKLGQPTISQHIQRLEKTAGRQLLRRDTHSVQLTADGEAMMGFAYAILDANEKAMRYLSGSTLSGQLRFGTSEDFTVNRLPSLLNDFIRRNPLVELELTVALSEPLFNYLDEGKLDLVLAKRRLGLGKEREARSGVSIGFERPIWLARKGMVIDPNRPLPLVTYPRPAITRAVATEALDRAGIPWRVSCTSGSLSGLHAAALAGLGVMVQPESMIPDGLVELPSSDLLPELEQIEFILAGTGRDLDPNAAELAKHIINNSDEFRPRRPVAAWSSNG